MGDFEGYQDSFSVVEKPDEMATNHFSKLNRKNISEIFFEESKTEWRFTSLSELIKTGQTSKE